MDRIESFEVFAQVAQTGSFSAVAKSRGLSPTMVGKHIRALEERLDTRLIQRTTRRQSLTDAGATYLEHVRRLLAEIDNADASIQLLRGTPRGILRVSCPVTFGTERLAPNLADYLRRCPEVRVELILNDRGPALPGDGVDAAVWIGALQDSSLVARPLAPYRMQMCASPAYLKRHGTPVKPADLEDHNCLGFTHWDHRDRWRLRGPRGEVIVSVQGSFAASNGQALRQAALAGMGVVLQPEALLGGDIEAGRLKVVLPDYEPAGRPMHLLFASDRRAAPKVRSFVDFMVERFGK